MKVLLYRDDEKSAHFKTEDGRLYYVHAHCDGTCAVVRVAKPYYWRRAHFENCQSVDEAIHRWFNGEEELVLSFLPLEESPII